MGFLEMFEGVKDGDSTLKAFLDLLTESVEFSQVQGMQEGMKAQCSHAATKSRYAMPNRHKQTGYKAVYSSGGL